jgi:hypothetical protein
MQTPAGEQLVLLSDGQEHSAVQVGSRLPNGFVVQAIGSNAVRLQHPATGTVADIPIPPPPSAQPAPRPAQ